MIQKLISSKLDRAFSLTFDFFNNLQEKDLKLKLPSLPSNTLGGQVWCMIGGRESYTRAINYASWQGFSCSLKNEHVQHEVIKSLRDSQDNMKEIDFGSLDETQYDFVLDLLEHEIQHHGQLIRLIRYAYENKLKFPKSWSKRYTV